MSKMKKLHKRPMWLALPTVPFLLTLGGATAGPRTVKFNDVVVGTGIRIRYAATGGSLGEPLIFLHGLSDSWFSFSEVLPRLAPRYRAFALDLRGHGGSERPDSGYSMRDFASDVVGFMDAMKLRRAAIIGHSMGSLVAREVAALVPERVTRLVLIGAPATGDNASTRELNAAILAFGDTIPRSFAHEFQVSTVHTPISVAFLNTAVDESMRLPPRVWRGAAAGMAKTVDPFALKSVRFPTLLVSGAQDTYFPRPEQDQLVKAIPNARLLVYESVGHAVHWERPAEFVRDLEAFLSK